MQRLAPGVQNRDGTDLGAQVAWVGGDVAKRLRRSAEQDRIHHRLVVKGDVSDWRRDGEHNVEVGYRQQLGPTRLQPFCARQSLALRTVPIAAGNGQSLLPALD